MKIEFQFNWHDSEDLAGEDASLSLGWIELKVEDRKYDLFKNNLCMVFITVSDLLGFIGSDSKEYNWVSVDGGEVCKLIRKNDMLSIKYQNSLVIAKYEDFKQALISSSKRLLESAKRINKSIDSESAFVDLEMSLTYVVNDTLLR